jgi:hypothetical protein
MTCFFGRRNCVIHNSRNVMIVRTFHCILFSFNEFLPIFWISPGWKLCYVRLIPGKMLGPTPVAGKLNLSSKKLSCWSAELWECLQDCIQLIRLTAMHGTVVDNPQRSQENIKTPTITYCSDKGRFNPPHARSCVKATWLLYIPPALT